VALLTMHVASLTQDIWQLHSLIQRLEDGGSSADDDDGSGRGGAGGE
jgi:hypothetical protein